MENILNKQLGYVGPKGKGRGKGGKGKSGNGSGKGSPKGGKGKGKSGKSSPKGKSKGKGKGKYKGTGNMTVDQILNALQPWNQTNKITDKSQIIQHTWGPSKSNHQGNWKTRLCKWAKAGTPWLCPHGGESCSYSHNCSLFDANGKLKKARVTMQDMSVTLATALGAGQDQSGDQGWDQEESWDEAWDQGWDQSWSSGAAWQSDGQDEGSAGGWEPPVGLASLIAGATAAYQPVSYTHLTLPTILLV